MPVLGLNHINIRTPDCQATVNFLRDALDLVVTAVPGHGQIDKAAWVHDAACEPIRHLDSADIACTPAEVLPAVPSRGSGAIHRGALSGWSMISLSKAIGWRPAASA